MVLAEIGKIISSSLRVEDIYEPFVEQVRKLVDFDRIDLALIDHETWTFRPAYVSGIRLPGDDLPDPTPLSRTNKEYIARTGARLLIGEHNLDSLAARIPTMKEPLAAGLRSAIAVPLTWHGRVIGVLTLRSKKRNAYGDQDVAHVSRVGAEITGAISAAEMHRALERDARERTVIAELGRIIGSSIHIDEVDERFIEQLRQLIPFDRIAIYSIDPETGNKSLNHIHGPAVPGWDAGVGVPPGPLTKLAMERGSGIIRHVGQVYSENHPHPWEDAGTRVGLKSALAVPLIQRGRVIGAMCLRTRTERAYSERDLLLAERVAAQMAAAVANAHLHSALQKEISEKTLLANVGRAASEAADVDGLIKHIYACLGQLVTFDRLQVELLNARTNALSESFTRGLEVPGLGEREERLELAGGQDTWSEIFGERAGSVVSAPGLSSHEIAAFRRAGLRSWAQAPLKTRNGVFGYVALQAQKEGAFTVRETRLLALVAAHIAPAVESLQLRHLLRQAQREREFLRAIRNDTPPSGNPDVYFQRLARVIAEVVPFDRLTVAAIDSQAGTVRPVFVDGENLPDDDRPLTCAADGSLTELVTRERRGQIVGSAPVADEAIIGPVRGTPGEAAAYRSGISLPLLSAPGVAFALHIRSRVARAYLDGDLALLEQAALAIAPCLELINPARSGIGTAASTPERRNGSAEGRSAAIKVVLVDDNELCRNGLAAVLDGTGIHVAAATGTRTAAPAVHRTEPAVVVYDVHGEDPVRPETITDIKRAFCDARVLVTAERASQERLMTAIRAGADGFVLKGGSPAALARVIEQVAAGGSVIESSLFKEFVQDLGGTVGAMTAGYRDKLATLTGRDREILAAIALGRTNAEIAQPLHLAVGTVRNRLVEIYRVLEVSDRAKAVYIATRAGLVK